MRKLLITLDGGITNIYAALWNNEGECLAFEREEIGLRDNGTNSAGNGRLKSCARDCICRLLNAGDGCHPEQIVAVYACGMLTSQNGISDVPHISAPAGRGDFIRAVKPVSIPEVFVRPIHCIPGLKNAADTPVDYSTLEDMNAIRGEAVEVLAMQEWFSQGEEYLFVLPGAQQFRFVSVDKQGNLTGCMTSIAGELLAMLTTRSSLADVLNGRFIDKREYNRELIIAGYTTAQKTSLPRAVFCVHLVNEFMTSNPSDCASFLVGAVLQSEIEAVKKSGTLHTEKNARVVVAGTDPLRTAMVDLFTVDGYFKNIVNFENPTEMLLSSRGAYRIAVDHGAFNRL